MFFARQKGPTNNITLKKKTNIILRNKKTQIIGISKTNMFLLLPYLRLRSNNTGNPHGPIIFGGHLIQGIVHTLALSPMALRRLEGVPQPHG